MKLIIEIELSKQEHPTYGSRILHALSGLVHEALSRDLAGEYVFTFPECDFGQIPPTDTHVRVTQEG